MSPDDFEALASSLKEPHFDLLLVGDGSGTKSTEPCGWCCHAYHRPSARVVRHFGCTSGGTTNFAELMPYLHCLWAFHAAHSAKRPSPPQAVHVLVVSDSELTVRCGSGKYARTANLALWAGIDWFVANGYQITWRHVSRNTNPMSENADNLAGRLRKLLVEQKKLP